jgi:hypothetical protein
MIDSFLEILQCVSVENMLVSPDEPLSVVVSDESVDALDFELAVTCFEATHRVILDYESLNLEEVGELTIRRMIEEHIVTEDRDLLDPLFVTKQFLAYRDSLLEALEELEE